MSIEAQVKKFEDGGYITAGGKKISFEVLGEPYPAPMACHNATFIWLYQATHDGAFPPRKSLEVGQTQLFVDKLIKFGNPSRVTEKSLPLAGDVLLFANPDAPTVALHSCVAINGGKTIAGYNQTGWFAGGLVDDYSEHAADSIDWVKRAAIFTRRRATAAGADRYIWAVREATAMGVMAKS
ncbi:hypothetical protein BH11PSE8_BH11PSE8_00620 [soil metagenome]